MFRQLFSGRTKPLSSTRPPNNSNIEVLNSRTTATPRIPAPPVITTAKNFRTNTQELEKRDKDLIVISDLLSCNKTKIETKVFRHNVNTAFFNDNYPIHYAVSCPDIMKYLIKIGANVNQKNTDNETPLFKIFKMKAISDKHVEVANLLLDAEADPTIVPPEFTKDLIISLENLKLGNLNDLIDRLKTYSDLMESYRKSKIDVAERAGTSPSATEGGRRKTRRRRSKRRITRRR